MMKRHVFLSLFASAALLALSAMPAHASDNERRADQSARLAMGANNSNPSARPSNRVGSQPDALGRVLERYLSHSTGVTSAPLRGYVPAQGIPSFGPAFAPSFSSPGRVISNAPYPYQSVAVKVSASQAKSIALRHVQGSEFLDIKLIDGNTYRVRVMKDGRRIDVYVDGNTGRVN